MADRDKRRQLARSEMQRRSDAYRNTLGRDSGHAQVVLEDLARFCRATESTFHPDARVAANLDGRREVWLRIRQHLDLDVDELLRRAGAVG